MNKLIWLRIAFWAGILMDAVATVQMLFPALMLRAYGIAITPGPEFTFAMRFGAPLMAGWTVLLIWADRRPVERRAILIITAFPVVAGLMAAELQAVFSGLVTLNQMVPPLIMQSALIILFCYGYSAGRSLHRAFCIGSEP